MGGALGGGGGGGPWGGGVVGVTKIGNLKKYVTFSCSLCWLQPKIELFASGKTKGKGGKKGVGGSVVFGCGGSVVDMREKAGKIGIVWCVGFLFDCLSGLFSSIRAIMGAWSGRCIPKLFNGGGWGTTEALPHRCLHIV